MHRHVAAFAMTLILLGGGTAPTLGAQSTVRQPATDADLPSNLAAPPALKPLLSRMWNQSRTFRRQCARIRGESRLLVRIHTAASVSQSRGRAATYFNRGGAGILEADVYLAGPVDLIELIAHEFEHVIEHVDGLDLRRLAGLAPTTVWVTAHGMFETRRATETGRVVAAEVDGGAY